MLRAVLFALEKGTTTEVAGLRKASRGFLRQLSKVLCPFVHETCKRLLRGAASRKREEFIAKINCEHLSQLEAEWS